MIQPIASRNIVNDDDSQVINALRGYAILLVILAHVTPHIPTLVWPAKRLMLMGVYGVQLFFIASALTLMMSWSRSRGDFQGRTERFFIKRIFRIVPLYYLAILFYWFVNNQQPTDFSWDVLLATLGFYNAWSPDLIPLGGGWMPVPGGWSIGVEFNFYLLFPFIALFVTTLKRAYIFSVISLLIMLVSVPIGQTLFNEFKPDILSNLLYFWLPNQLVVFSAGFILFYILVKKDLSQKTLNYSELTRVKSSILFLVAFFALSFYSQKKLFHDGSWSIPTHVLITILFTWWAHSLIVNPSKLVVNKAICSLGKVSFSGYVLHFAALKATSFLLGSIWIFSKDGLMSLVYVVIFTIIAVALTYISASVTYKYIELPFMKIGKNLSKAS